MAFYNCLWYVGTDGRLARLPSVISSTRFDSFRGMENFFLCYECGATHRTKSDFDEHVFVHQAVALCYQLYEFEKKESAAKDKEESRHPGDSDKKSQQIKSSSSHRKQSNDSQRSNTRKASTATAATAPKRKLPDPFPPISDTSSASSSISSKAPAIKKKKTSHGEGKISRTLDDKTHESVLPGAAKHPTNAQAEKEASGGIPGEQLKPSTGEALTPVAVAKPQAASSFPVPMVPRAEKVSKKKLMPEPLHVVVEPPRNPDIAKPTATTATTKITPVPATAATEAQAGTITVHPEIAATPSKSPVGMTMTGTSSTATAPDKTSLPVSAATATALEGTAAVPAKKTTALHSTATTAPAQAATTASNNPAHPKCPSCNYRSSHGTDMVEHVVRVHKTAITSLQKTDFVDGKWTEKISLEPRQQCAYCVRSFPELTDYFLHVIVCHKSNLLSPGVSKYHCIVHLSHPEMAIQMVHIYMKRPEVKS